MKKKSFNTIISLVIGIGLFGFFLYKSGPEDVINIINNLNLFYFIIFLFLGLCVFLLAALRWQIILNAHGKKSGFFILLKQTLAGYAISYLTPAARAGGEPLRVYMLKKELGIDSKIGASSVIIDKFVELTGAVIFGMIGIFLLLHIQGIGLVLKLVLIGIIILGFCILLIFYYRAVTGKGSFSSLFNLLRFYKIMKLKNFLKAVENVEVKMQKFFVNHKKEFLLSFLVYLIYSLVMILDFKILLLALGFNASIIEVILSILIQGLVSFIPVPASLGFLEAGQSQLFSLIKQSGSLGFALSLLIRLKDLLFVAVGFSIISYFSGKQLRKVYQKNVKKNI